MPEPRIVPVKGILVAFALVAGFAGWAVALVVTPGVHVWIVSGFWALIAAGFLLRMLRPGRSPRQPVDPGRSALSAYESNYLNRATPRIDWPIDATTETSVTVEPPADDVRGRSITIRIEDAEPDRSRPTPEPPGAR
jgi:hypothetical protein